MFWKTVFIYPLANTLVFLVGLFGGNIGLGIIGLTLVVKVVLLPLSYRATVFQLKHQKLQPLIKEIQEKYTDKKEQSEKIMALYKEHNANPLGCLVLFLQLPVMFALYRVIIAGIPAYSDHLYSFVTMPAVTSSMFLGMDLSEVSIILAIISGAVQFVQIHYATASQAQPTKSNQKDMASSMQQSMKYTIPMAIVIVGITLPAALSLYIIIMNIFTIVQDQLIKRILARKEMRAQSALQ